MALSTSVVSADPASHETDLLALLVREGEKLGAVDASLDGLLSRCAKEEEFTGKEGQVLTLHTHGEAVAWNAALPCSGRILSIHGKGDTATATFLLGDRSHSQCDGPGQRATAIFKVVKGRIVLWHQTGSAGPPPPTI